jgi:DNA invertase Pin-like site-specific DNA recombinase
MPRSFFFITPAGPLRPHISVTNMTDMRLIAYARTSTQNGAGQDSLDAQAEACAAWAAQHGHEIVSVCRDEAVSGTLPVEQRPGLLDALMGLEDESAEGIVVHRLDRLARELHIQEAALARAWSAGDHVEVFESVEGIIKRDDPDDPHRTFLRQVLGAAAQLERGLVKARLQGGRRRKASKGGYIGGKVNPKYGYDLVDGVYVERDDQQQVIARIGALRDNDGRSSLPWATVAGILNAEGIPAPNGREWYPMTVRRIGQKHGAR